MKAETLTSDVLSKRMHDKRKVYNWVRNYVLKTEPCICSCLAAGKEEIYVDRNINDSASMNLVTSDPKLNITRAPALLSEAYLRRLVFIMLQCFFKHLSTRKS